MTPKPTTDELAGALRLALEPLLAHLIATHSEKRITLTIDEACKAMGISKPTFRQYVMPELRLYFVGRKPLIPVSELQKHVEREARRAGISELTQIGRSKRFA